MGLNTRRSFQICLPTHFSAFLFPISILSLLSGQGLLIINKNVLLTRQEVYFQKAGPTFDLQNHRRLLALESALSLQMSWMIFLFALKFPLCLI